MKTAILTGSVSRTGGGISEICRRLSQSLMAYQSSAVEVIALRDEFSEEALASWYPIQPKLVPRAGPWAYGYSPELSAALDGSQPELVHVHGIWMYQSLCGSRWARRRNKGLLITLHGMLEPGAFSESKWKKVLALNLFERRFLQSAGCLQVNTKRELANLRTAGFNQPVCVIPNGIDIPAERATCRPPWEGRLPQGGKILLYLGRLHPKKGLVNLVKAFGQLQRGMSGAREWMLVIAGWDQGGHEAKLKQLARDENIAGSVYFAGPQFGDYKLAAYQHADAFILPSYTEGLPMVVLEAWSNRLPVVITPECNLLEGFETTSAIRIEPNVHAIQHGLRELVAMSDAERRAMGMRGQDLVRQRFTWEKVSQQMSRVYQWLLGSEPPTDILHHARN